MKDNVRRLGVIDLSHLISDLEYWCTGCGESLIIEKLQEKIQMLGWRTGDPDREPTEEEITEEKKKIQRRVADLKKLQKESEEKPTPVFWLRDLYMGDCPWGGKEFDFFFLFKDILYGAKGPYTEEESALLCFQLYEKERETFDALKNRLEGTEDSSGESTRQAISEKVRIFVWRRDGAKCAKCGSRERLEFDHIIPVSKGGGSTARNIELLCESCNRAKSDAIS
ncbi:MAG: HNH endonuclease [Verrucomicrobiota bacterium]